MVFYVLSLKYIIDRVKIYHNDITCGKSLRAGVGNDVKQRQDMDKSEASDELGEGRWLADIGGEELNMFTLVRYFMFAQRSTLLVKFEGYHQVELKHSLFYGDEQAVC